MAVDIAIALIWLVFGINLIGQSSNAVKAHVCSRMWFYIAIRYGGRASHR